MADLGSSFSHHQSHEGDPMPRFVTPRSPVPTDRCKCQSNPLCADPGNVLPFNGPASYPMTFPPLLLGTVSGARNSAWPLWAALLSLLFLAFSAVSAKAQTVNNACQSASKKDPLSACKRDPLRQAA